MSKQECRQNNSTSLQATFHNSFNSYSWLFGCLQTLLSLSLYIYIYVLHLFLAQLPYLPWLQCRALLANHLGSTGDPCSVVYSTSGLDWVSLSCSPHRNECSHPCTVDSRHSRLSRLVRCNESEVLRIRSAVVLVLPLIRFGPGEEGFGVLWTCGFDVQ